MTQTPPNRATRRANLKTSQARRHAHNQDPFTLRQRRIERERDERERTTELIEKRKNDVLREMRLQMTMNMNMMVGNGDDGDISQEGEKQTETLTYMGTWVRGTILCIKEADVNCTWYVPITGFLLGIIIGILRNFLQ